jgi:TRAP-type C4-dicarboxylate transport system substrate-binding protein
VNRLFVAALLIALAPTGRADPVTIKLGTLAPAGSAWHDALKDMAQRWEQVSQGQVKLRVYAGGTQGSEGDMLRKLAIGQLQAAAVSNVGMHDVVREPQTFSVPLLFSDEVEMECAFQRVKGKLEAAFQERGMVVLQWSRLGSAAFFCNAPFRTPAEMASARIFAWEGDPGAVKAWRAAGFRPVVLSSTDLLPALTTGMIDCVSHVPLYMLTSRAFEKARFHLDLPLGFVLGATIVKRDAWERIPAEARPRLVAVAAEVAAKIDSEIRRLNADAVDAMRRQGLTSVAVAPEAWRPTLERSWAVLRGESLPAPFFDEVKEAREACRKQAAAGHAGAR